MTEPHPEGVECTLEEFISTLSESEVLRFKMQARDRDQADTASESTDTAGSTTSWLAASMTAKK